MRQSRTSSLTEDLANVMGGYGLAPVLQRLLFPAYGLHPPLDQSLQLGLARTALSVLRSYALRRWSDRLGAP